MKVDYKKTRNGIILNRDFLDGEAQEFAPNLISDMFKMDDGKYKDRVYSLAHSYDTRLSGVTDLMSEENNKKQI